MKIGALEDELILTIKASPLGARVREVAGLPDGNADTLVKRFRTTAPAVYVSPAPFDVAAPTASPVFEVLAVARNARGQRDARHGDGSVIGLYEMIDILLPLLSESCTASSGWSVTRIGFGRQELFADHGLHAASLTLRGRIEVSQDIDAAALDAFVIFHADYDIAPADGAIDATDHVTLPQ